MVAEREVDLLGGEVLAKKRRYGLDDVGLVLPRLVPYIVSGKIASHVHPVKLETQVLR